MHSNPKNKKDDTKGRKKERKEERKEEIKPPKNLYELVPCAAELPSETTATLPTVRRDWMTPSFSFIRVQKYCSNSKYDMFLAAAQALIAGFESKHSNLTSSPQKLITGSGKRLAISKKKPLRNG